MSAPVLTGPQYLSQGLKLVLSPGLRLFVLLPLCINLILFVGLISLSMQQFGGWVRAEPPPPSQPSRYAAYRPTATL